MTVTLHVCITCRESQSPGEGETTPGARQIACADIVLLTKADLPGAEGREAAMAVIAAGMLGRVPMLPAVDGANEARVIFGLDAAA